MWVPATIAFDILSVLLLARLVRLDVALVISRVLWTGVGGAWIARNRHLIAVPRGLTRKQVAVIVASGLAALLLSMSISRPSSIWDRQFHIPVVTGIRSQQLPFLNAYQTHAILHYHFAGNVVAAALQTFSAGRLHASLGLALAHDLTFMLFGACLSAWISSLATKRIWIIFAVSAVFLSGPFSVQRSDLTNLGNGYSFVNFLCISFRPHVNLAAVFLLGIFAPLFIRAEGADQSRWGAITKVMICMAALGITDEASAALMLGALGVVWIVCPDTLAPRRSHGVLILLMLAVAIFLPNFLFEASLAPGGPVQKLKFVPLRSPGFSLPPIPLSNPQGRFALLTDLAPFLLVMVALVGAALRKRAFQAWRWPLFFAALLGAATLGLTILDVNGAHLENHRFMTVCMVLFPVVAILLLVRLPAGFWERIPLIGALLLSSVSTFHWYQHGIGAPLEYFTNPVDCRASAGAQLFEKPVATYVPVAHFFKYAGCRPVFAPGVRDGWQQLYTGNPVGGREALAQLDSDFLKPGQPLTAACPSSEVTTDPVCTHARARSLCKPVGTDFDVCTLSSSDRKLLLTQHW